MRIVLVLLAWGLPALAFAQAPASYVVRLDALRTRIESRSFDEAG